MGTESTYAYDVFLSYSSGDKEQVRDLATKLHGAGVRVWFDDWVVQAGDDIYLAVEDGLQASRTLILCMSPHAFASEWVGLERSTMLFRDPRNAERRFLPLLLADAEIPPTLRRFKHIDWRQPDDRDLQGLLQTIRGAVSSISRLDPAYVTHVDALARFVERELRHGIFSVHDTDRVQQPTMKGNDDAEEVGVLEAYTPRIPIWLSDTSGTVASSADPPTYSDLAAAVQRIGTPLVVVGSPGSGKSTTLLNYSRERITALRKGVGGHIPVFVPVESWQSHETIPRWIERVTGLAPEHLELDNRDSAVLLLFDGLDELPGQELQFGFFRDLAATITAPWILTCRSDEFGQIALDLRRVGVLSPPILEINPLTGEQVFAYLQHNEKLIQAIRDDEWLAMLVRTPLLLTLMRLATENQSGAATIGHPQRRPEMGWRDAKWNRDHVARLFVRRRYDYEAGRGRRTPRNPLDFVSETLGRLAPRYSLDVVYETLGRLASSIVNHASNRVYCTIEDIAKALEKRRGDAADFATFACNLQLLAATDNHRFRFKHLLLRDHFAIADALPRLDSKDDFERAMAVQTICQVGDTEPLLEVMRLLDDRSSFVLQSTLMAIAKGGNSETLKALIDRLPSLTRGDGMVIFYFERAVSAVASRFPETMLGFLHHPSKEIKDFAGEIIRKFAGDPEIPALLKALESDDADTRWWAEQLLVAVGKHAANWVVPQLKHASPYVRASAADVLGAITAVESVPALIRTVADPVDDVRAAAVAALGRIGTAPCWDPIFRTTSDNAAIVRISAVKALAKSSMSHTPSVLNRMVHDSDPGVRAAVAWTFGERKEPDALPVLIAYLDEHDDSVVGASACALEAFLPPDLDVASEKTIARPTVKTPLMLHLKEVAVPPLLRALERCGDSEAGYFICKLLQRLEEAPVRCAEIMRQRQVNTFVS
jgi:HEAT repeat protein